MLNILGFLIDLIDRQVIWIYALCFLLILLQIRAYAQALQNRRNTIFPVEREVAIYREGRAMSNVGAILGVVALVVVLKYYVVPTIDVGALVEPTPTLVLAIPTATSTMTPTVVPVTPTPRPKPTSPPVVTVIIPTNTPAPPHPCGDPNTMIQAPLMGARVSGTVTIRGTANHGQFQFYKIELGPGEEPAGWHVVNDIHRAPVIDGVLETLDTAALPNGTYWLKLTVVDRTGNFPPPCHIRVAVQN